MKFDKKLKNLIDRSGEELREKHKDFYEETVAKLYGEPAKKPPVQSEPRNKPFWRAGFFAAAACCLVVALGVGIFIGSMLPDRNKVTIDAGSSSNQPSSIVPTDSAPEFRFALKSNGEFVEAQGAIDFGRVTLGFDRYSVSENSTVTGEDGNIAAHYILGSAGSEWFQVLVMSDGAYSYDSKLASDKIVEFSTNENVVFRYMSVGEAGGLAYFYAEAVSGEDRLAIEYMTASSDGDATFKAFLEYIVRPSAAVSSVQ